MGKKELQKTIDSFVKVTKNLNLYIKEQDKVNKILLKRIEALEKCVIKYDSK